jgi:hypothetical protein
MNLRHLINSFITSAAFLSFSGIAIAADAPGGVAFPNSIKSITIVSTFGLISVIFLCYIFLKYGGEAK